jgi:hypothetical protein
MQNICTQTNIFTHDFLVNQLNVCSKINKCSHTRGMLYMLSMYVFILHRQTYSLYPKKNVILEILRHIINEVK